MILRRLSTGICLFIQIFITVNIYSQDPNRFASEIEVISNKAIPTSGDVIIFTGSSSIRLWNGLKKDCSDMPIVNTGFGGSHMSDLLHFVQDAVLRFEPTEVYIYEGDNDISSGKSPSSVLETAKEVVQQILTALPDVRIHFISAKPSPSRWMYKDAYLEFNTLLTKYCEGHSQLFYIDVWTDMLNHLGRPKPEIFVVDSLHMNRKGYEIWKDIICTGSQN